MSITQLLHEQRPQVLDALLRVYGRSIQATAFAVLRNTEDAEEVLVETILSALEHGRDLRDSDALRPWLLKIATNKALGLRRRRWRLVHFDQALGDRFAGRSVRTEESLDLADSLDKLPERTRAALVLRYYAGFGVDDVVATVGLTPLATTRSDALSGRAIGGWTRTGGTHTDPFPPPNHPRRLDRYLPMPSRVSGPRRSLGANGSARSTCAS
jgi:RNA polymerase sigma factor (sigma-70 family)